MLTAPPGRKAIWVLPIVLAICALMVLPGGAFLASSAHGGNPMASAAGVSSAPARPVTAAPTAPTPPGVVAGTPSSSSLGPSVLSTPAPASSGGQFSPSSYGPTSNIASSLPSYLQNVPWVKNLEHPHSGIAPLASVPNLQMLEHPDHVTAGLVHPAYESAPAPLGIGDYGLGVTPYAYNASYMDGEVTFAAAPNVTQPAATNVIAPSAAAERLGYVGSEYEFGIQLNTIGINLTIPGDYNSTSNDWSGYVWAQNVVNWNSTGLHFIQDTWNFSLDSGSYWNYNSIYSGCGGNTAHANYILYLYGFVFQCSEGNVPLTAADYPVTLSLYNNFTTNAQDRSQLVYGYSIYEAGTGTTISGVADTVVFNNTVPSYSSPMAPSNAPANSVDPFAVAPFAGPGRGAEIDSEIDIVGGIEGDDGVFSAINGSAQLMYANLTHDVFQNVPSAYNFGSDTGETSYGIADYWTPSHVLEINQGPSMLYGLWNAEPQASVPSGDVQIAGSISPAYGFVFVSNSPPVLDPWAETQTDNMSWLPTSAAGTFDTYLPPLKAPWTTTYYVQAFADGYTEYNTTVTASTAALSIAMAASAGVLNAPLYMNGVAQASALAKAIGGLGTAPYLFEDLTVNVNMSFDRLNDWSFPTFEVFQAEDANSVVVNNVYLGTDSTVSGNSYFYDYSVGPDFFSAPMAVFLDQPYITSGINIFYGAADQVLNQELEELCPLNSLFDSYDCLGDNGLQMTLWGDTATWVNATFAEDEYPGVWVGDSFNTLVTNTTDEYGYGVTDIGSFGTTVAYLTAFEALGISAAGSFNGFYFDIGVEEHATGIEAGTDYGPTVSSIYDIPGTVDLTVENLFVFDDSLGANITFSTGTTFDGVEAVDPTDYGSRGIALDGVSDTTVNELDAEYASGFYVWNATDITFNDLFLQYASYYYYNSEVLASTGVVFNAPYIDEVEYEEDDAAYSAVGVVGLYDTGITINAGFAYDDFGGMVFEYPNGFTATGLNSEDSEFSYELDYGTGTTSVNYVNATDDYIGFNLWNTYPATVKNVDAADDTGYGEYYGGGVALYNDTGNTVTGVTADDATGVKVDSGGSGNTVSNVLAEYEEEEITVGVGILAANSNSVTSVTAEDDAVGVLLGNGAESNTVSDVTAEYGAIGVECDGSLGNTISAVTAMYGATGVEVDPSTGVSISNVAASYSSVGVYIEDSQDISVSTITPTEYSVGVWTWESNDITLKAITDVPGSIGAIVEESQFVTVSDVTAKGTGTALSPFAYSLDVEDSSVPGAAVDTLDSVGVTITDVTVTDFPAALYDEDSSGLTVTDLNATGGFYAAVLNGTFSSLFTGVGAFQDYQGILMEEDAEDNTITGSSFVDDTSYGVAIASGYDNTVYDNDFIGDNGATTTYSPVHIQAFGADYNYFYICTNEACSTGVGNSWADWHTYGSNGFLAPYWLSGTSVDEFPIGPEETFVISFTETGLAAGTSWSVTLSGITMTSTASAINFTVPMGSYLYQVNPVAGYSATPTGGSITEAGAPYNVPVTFTATTYAVTLSESGLSTGTSWGATVNGVVQSTTGTTLTFYLPAGAAYHYSFNAVSGYNLPATGASGTFNVTTEPVSLATTYSPTSTPSYVQTSDFNNWLAVAIAVAVIALVIGLLALMLRGRKEPPAPAAQPWSPPPASSGGAPPAAGGTSTWSEGPPSGGSPPSS